MLCPSCGAESTGTKFCENCGCPLPSVAEQQAFQSDPTLQMPAQQQAYQPDPTLQMPAQQQAYQPDPTLQMPTQQQPASYASPQQGAGGYVPPTGGSPAGGAHAVGGQPPYQQTTSYQPATLGQKAPNAAFVLAIVGLVLSVLFVTFLPGIVCSIIALVLNSGYNKKGLYNPHKTSTFVLGIIGIVIAVLCAVSAIALGVLTAQVVDELDRQGVDITTNSVSVTTDSSGNINVTVKDSSGSASASSAATGSQSSASSASAAGSSAAASSAASTSASAASLERFEEDIYHDAEWNPTLYSVVELTGAEMNDLLEYYGFDWDDSRVGWTAKDGSLYAVSTTSGELTKSQIAALPAGAAGQPAVIGMAVSGYSSPNAAFSALSSSIVVEDKVEADGSVFAIVYGSPMVRYLAITTTVDDGQQAFLLCTDESISSGLFTNITGIDAGSSIKEVWQMVKSSSGKVV